MSWEKLEDTMNPTWNDKDIKDGATVIGILKDVKHNVGPNESTIYDLETKEGVVGVWGSTILDTRLKNTSVGDEIKIVYNGYKKSEKTGRDYKDYTVYKRTPVVSEDEIAF